MTGLECLRREMKKRGASEAMCKSKTAAMVLDILAETQDGIYAETQEAEEKEASLLKRVRYAEENYSSVEYRLRAAEAQLSVINRKITEGKSQLTKAKQKELEDAREYIEKFNKSLEQCELPKARDQMRTAQLFMDAAEVNTKYDNTAFIIGLAAILSGGKIAPIDELKKINKKIASYDFPAWLDDFEDDNVVELD